MGRKISVLGTGNTLTPGETFETTVHIELEKPTRVRGIKARFFGAERTEADYTTTSTDSKGRTTTHHHTAVDYVPIVEERIVLHGTPSTGFFNGIGDAVSTMPYRNRVALFSESWSGECSRRRLRDRRCSHLQRLGCRFDDAQVAVSDETDFERWSAQRMNFLDREACLQLSRCQSDRQLFHQQQQSTVIKHFVFTARCLVEMVNVQRGLAFESNRKLGLNVAHQRDRL